MSYFTEGMRQDYVNLVRADDVTGEEDVSNTELGRIMREVFGFQRPVLAENVDKFIELNADSLGAEMAEIFVLRINEEPELAMYIARIVFEEMSPETMVAYLTREASQQVRRLLLEALTSGDSIIDWSQDFPSSQEKYKHLLRVLISGELGVKPVSQMEQ